MMIVINLLFAAAPQLPPKFSPQDASFSHAILDPRNIQRDKTSILENLFTDIMTRGEAFDLVRLNLDLSEYKDTIIPKETLDRCDEIRQMSPEERDKQEEVELGQDAASIVEKLELTEEKINTIQQNLKGKYWDSKTKGFYEKLFKIWNAYTKQKLNPNHL